MIVQTALFFFDAETELETISKLKKYILSASKHFSKQTTGISNHNLFYTVLKPNRPVKPEYLELCVQRINEAVVSVKEDEFSKYEEDISNLIKARNYFMYQLELLKSMPDKLTQCTATIE